MKKRIVFSAPWSISVKLITIFTIGLLIGISIHGLLNNPNNEIVWLMTMVIFPLTILMLAALFMIRGYELTQDKLFIQRLGWKTEINLKDLKAVKIDPEAMKGSIRTFGNGGLFCFAGRFWNKKLGPYRAFATNPKLAVILKFTKKVVIITPENPSKFLAEINTNKTDTNVF